MKHGMSCCTAPRGAIEDIAEMRRRAGRRGHVLDEGQSHPLLLWSCIGPRVHGASGDRAGDLALSQREQATVQLAEADAVRLVAFAAEPLESRAACDDVSHERLEHHASGRVGEPVQPRSLLRHKGDHGSEPLGFCVGAASQGVAHLLERLGVRGATFRSLRDCERRCVVHALRAEPLAWVDRCDRLDALERAPPKRGRLGDHLRHLLRSAVASGGVLLEHPSLKRRGQIALADRSHVPHAAAQAIEPGFIGERDQCADAIGRGTQEELDDQERRTVLSGGTDARSPCRGLLRRSEVRGRPFVRGAEQAMSVGVILGDLPSLDV
jgi:hypothetical protein